MHVLVSPEASAVEGRLAGPGHIGSEFCWTVPGELLIPGAPCDSSSCGCDRSFTGLVTRKGTTVGVVADLAMTEAEFLGSVRESTERAGWDSEDVQAAYADMAGWMLGRLAELPSGALVRVRHENGGVVLDAV